MLLSLERTSMLVRCGRWAWKFGLLGGFASAMVVGCGGDDSSGEPGTGGAAGSHDGGTGGGTGGAGGGGTGGSKDAGKDGAAGSNDGGPKSDAGDGGIVAAGPQGKPGYDLVAGATVMRAPLFTLIVTLGESPGGNGALGDDHKTMHSALYKLQTGIVPATQK